MRTYANRALHVPDAGIGSIMNYASKYSDTVSLGQGAPQFETPKYIYEGILKQSQTDKGLGMYNSTGDNYHRQLKKYISQEFSEIYNYTPSPEELYLTVGGIGGLFAALMIVLEAGDEVIYFDPSYPLHLSQFAICEAKPIFVPYQEDNGWKINIDLLKKSITPKTKAIVLTNPNNPTGTVISQKEMMQIAEIVINNDLYLVVDEAYGFLTFEQELFSPMKIDELRPHIILSKSFSKEYAMTGWRIGYLWANKEILQKINSIHLHFSINPATPSIAAAILAISDPRGKAARAQIIENIRESRNAICTRLTKLPNLFTFQKPQGAFYVFPKINLKQINAIDFAKKLIDEAKVITIPGDSMGPTGQGHLRMSFAANPDVINSAFDRLDKFSEKNYG